MTKRISTTIVTLILLITSIAVMGCGVNKKVKLKKIVFHSSACFGNCPTYHLELAGDKSIRLYAEKVYVAGSLAPPIPDSTKVGYYTGKVSDSLYALLNNELETIGLNKLKFDDITCCDGSVVTIIVYYNNKRKYLKSMFPPKQASNLISLLFEICKTSNLQKTSTAFVLEDKK